MTTRTNAALTRRWAWVDPGLTVVLAMATLAAWPLLTRTSLPTFTDAHHHIYRTYEVLTAWRQGILYPRWAPDFYYGFGYPVFNYYSTLTYYLAAPYGWFFGPVAGIKFVFVLATYLGPVGVYLFARDEWGPAAAIVSAAVYAFAPYIVFTDPIQRGALPETLAIALAPIVLWSFTRLARTGLMVYFFLATLSLAALGLAHNLMSLVFAAVLGAWLLWVLLLMHKPNGPAAFARAVGLIAAAGLLALGLAAFMWLPAAAERGAVQFQNAFSFAEARRFLSFGELFAPMTNSDLQMFYITDYTFRLGWPQWIAGLLGAITIIRPSEHRRATLFWMLATLPCLFLMDPSSTWLWDHINVLPYLQFSYRLLGVTALSLAFLAGAALDWSGLVQGRMSRNGLAAAVVAVAIFAGLPLLNPLPWAEFGPVNRQAILDLDLFEIWGVGTTMQGEFLPTTVAAKPKPAPAVMSAIASDGHEKVDRATLPTGASVTSTGYNPQSDQFQISTPVAFTLRLFTLDWPGWTAYLDGVQVAIQPTQPEGFVSVRVPPGAHALTVRLEDTWPRRLAWIISGAALLGMLALVGWCVVTRQWRRLSPAPLPAEHLARQLAGLVVGIVAAGLLARAGLDFGIRWQVAHTTPRIATAQVQKSTRFADGMALVAYDFPLTRAKPGDRVPIRLYLEAISDVKEPASVFVHFYAPDGQLWGQADQPEPLLFFPTTRWPLGRVMADDLTAVLKPNAPPGQYTVAVGLWNRATGARSHPLNDTGQPTDQDKLILTREFQVGP